MSNLSNWTNGIEGEGDQGNMKDTKKDLPAGDPTYECKMKELQTLGCYSEVTNLGEAASSYMQTSEHGSAEESTNSNVSLVKEGHMCEQVSANNDIRLEGHDSCVNTLSNSALRGMEVPPQNVERDQGDAGTLAGGSDQSNDYQSGPMNDHPGNHTNDRGANQGEAAPPVEDKQPFEVNKNNLHVGQIEEEQADGCVKWTPQEEHSKITKEITQPAWGENDHSERSHSNDVNDYTLFGQREREAVEVECMRNVPIEGEAFPGEDPRGDYCDADREILSPIQEEPNVLISSDNQYEPAQVNTFSSNSKQTHGEGEEVRPSSENNSNDGIANKLTIASAEEEKKKEENFNIQEKQNGKYKNNDEVIEKENGPRVSAPSDEAINCGSLGTDASRSSDSMGSSEGAANQIEVNSQKWANREITQNEYKKKRDITEVGDDSLLSNAKKKINFSSPVNNALMCNHQGGENCDANEFEGSKMSSPPCDALGFNAVKVDVVGANKPNINACAPMPSSELIAAHATEGVPREQATTGRETPSDVLQPCDIALPPNGIVHANAPPNVCTTPNAPENTCDEIHDLARIGNANIMPTSVYSKMDAIPPETHAESGISPPDEVTHAHAPVKKLQWTHFDVCNAEGELPRGEKNGKDGKDETNISRSANEKKLSSHTIVSNLEIENKTEPKIGVEQEIAVEHEVGVQREISGKCEKRAENFKSEKIASSEKNSKGQKGTPRVETTQVALHTPMEETAHAPNPAGSSSPDISSMSFNEVPLGNLNQGLSNKQMQRQNSKQFPSDTQPFAIDQGTNTFSTNHRSSVEPVGENNLQKDPPMKNLKNGATINDHVDMCTLGSEDQGEELMGHLSYGTNGLIDDDLARELPLTSPKTADVANAHQSGTSLRSESDLNGVSDQGAAVFMNVEQLENYLNEQIRTNNPVHRELPLDTIPRQIIKKKTSEDTTIQDNENDHMEYRNNEMVMRKISQDTIVNDVIEEGNMSMERNKEMIFKKITEEVAISSMHKPNGGHVSSDRMVKNVNLDTTMRCMQSGNIGTVGKDIILNKLSEHESVGELLSGMHHVDDSNEESTRDDLYHHQHVLYNQNNQMNGRNFKEEINPQNMMNFHDQRNLISCAHNDTLGNQCEVNGAYNNGLNNHTMRNNTKEVDTCSNVDFTDDKYSQWFDTIYTVCVKLDDLCCKLNSDYPHSMNIWESNGNPNVYDLKSAFQNSNNLKMFSQNNQVDKVSAPLPATVPPSIYNDLNSSDSSGNSNYRYAVTQVSNHNEGPMKRHDHFAQDNFENGLSAHVKNNCKDGRSIYGMNNINSNNQYVKDLAHVYSSCDDHLRRIQTKGENGKGGRKIQHEYALQREMYNHGNSNTVQDSTHLYDREKNGMKTNIAVLPGALSKDALELLHAYGKVELYNALPQYKGHGDGTDRANHTNCGHRSATPFSNGIPNVINNSSMDTHPRNGDPLSMAKFPNAKEFMQYVKNENNDGSLNANNTSANTTKRKKGSKRNTTSNNKSVEKKNIKKYGTVNRTNAKIIKNESEFEYLLELSDKEGPNLENPDDLKCDVAGVYWDKRSWIASWYDNGKRYYKSFSAKTHGFYKSKFWAIKVRLSKVKGQTIFGKNCRKNKDAEGSNGVHNNLTFNSSIVSENNNVLLGNI
ncbi:Uncharacterized protein PCOAH_00027670 [Plasmodium coatneyi]|uniref:Uncharacterized protein n=1 Tax=Plasmodium coatneyi TaxID=208452 RepID=A0A1B1E0L7_9APIC|nr:Uncharacterized protein PCOAH_00027670 [Plasmodium coatneyi]ANQ08397.1 Uncharacterized protein PCOAH_00027670 [Plasmodium coatneyi]